MPPGTWTRRTWTRCLLVPEPGVPEPDASWYLNQAYLNQMPPGTWTRRTWIRCLLVPELNASWYLNQMPPGTRTRCLLVPEPDASCYPNQMPPATWNQYLGSRRPGGWADRVASSVDRNGCTCRYLKLSIKADSVNLTCSDLIGGSGPNVWRGHNRSIGTAQNTITGLRDGGPHLRNQQWWAKRLGRIV